MFLYLPTINTTNKKGKKKVMEITFAPKGILQIDNARICFRNFAGEAGKYNREGDRNFALVIPNQELADALIDEGWNVKINEPREEGGDPFMYLNVKVKFNGRGPHVYVQSGNNMNRIDEEDVGMIDDLDIESVDLDIRPYDWEVNGKTGRTAYLQSIKVVQNIDRFSAMMAERESPRE